MFVVKGIGKGTRLQRSRVRNQVLSSWSINAAIQRSYYRSRMPFCYGSTINTALRWSRSYPLQQSGLQVPSGVVICP